MRSLLIAGGLVLVVILALGIRLAVGPISLGFLKAEMETALNQRLPDYTTALDDVVLVWDGWEEGVDLRALQISVLDGQGAALANIDQIAVGFAPGDLLVGRLAPDSLRIFSAHLKLLRREDGSLGFQAISSGQKSSAMLEFLLESLLADGGGESFSRLDEVSFADATIDVEDVIARQDWQITDVEFMIARSETGLDVQLNGMLHADQATTSLAVAMSYDRELDQAGLQVQLDHFIPAEFHRDFGFWRHLAGIETPVSGTVSVSTGDQWNIEHVTFAINLDEGTIYRPKLFERSFNVTEGSLVGELDRAQGRLDLDTVDLRFGDATIEASASIFLDGEGIGYVADAEMKQLSFPMLARIWPITFKPFSRGWVARNLTAGKIINAKAHLELPPDFKADEPLPDGSFNATLSFEGMTVHYLPPMPPVSGGVGHGTFTASTLDITMESGRIVDAASGMHLQLDQGQVVLDKLNVRGGNTADIWAELSGTVADMVQATTFEPLGYAQAYGIDPGTLGGLGKARIDVQFPLLRKLALADVDLHVQAQVEGFETVILGGQTTISQGNLALDIDLERLIAQGDVVVGGLPFEARWLEDFSPDDGQSSSVSLDGLHPASQLGEALGLSLPFDGQIGVKLDMQGAGLGITQGTGSFDFAGVDAEVAVIDWHKKVSEPASLTYSFDVVDNGLNINTFAFDHERMQVEGTGFLDDGLVPRLMNVSKLQTGQTDVQAEVRFTDEAIEGHVSGTRLDVRPFISSFFAEGDGATSGNASISLNIDRILAEEETELTDLDGIVTMRDGQLQDVHVSAVLPSAAPLSIDYYPAGDVQELMINSDDGGQLVKAFGVYGGAAGGLFTLSATTDISVDEGRTEGRIKITDFKVEDAPALAQVLNIGSLGGIRDMLSGGGLSFDRFHLGFAIDNGELAFRDAVALGPSIGLRMSGRLHDDLQQIDIEGLIIPAYTINTIIRSVPIVGDILTGGGKDAVLGIDFAMTGPVEDPEIKVNPGSILTPGFVTNIFGGD